MEGYFAEVPGFPALSVSISSWSSLNSGIESSSSALSSSVNSGISDFCESSDSSASIVSFTSSDAVSTSAVFSDAFSLSTTFPENSDTFSVPLVKSAAQTGLPTVADIVTANNIVKTFLFMFYPPFAVNLFPCMQDYLCIQRNHCSEFSFFIFFNKRLRLSGVILR